MPAAALVLLLLPVVQGTPAASPLTTGTRVRVTTREAGAERVRVGPLRTFDGQNLTLSTEGGPSHVSLPRTSITRIEVSRGRRGHAASGALLGAVLGLAVVALKDVGCGEDCTREGASTGFILAAVGGGTLLGGGVGMAVRSERWESLPWAVGPARRASVVPLPPAPLGLRVALRF
jgi:hypothetical protein